ncbi:MAG TPA: aminotransferase class I/II-fold pyridoxal phosphate-dependent enzyme [Acidimicrobiales bacterium]|nr:aminotransferase class I/II-fold pyridoxal phosphate-dependent enzyme [Acidimicrobiales bacterium]
MVTKISAVIDIAMLERTSRGVARALSEAIGDGSLVEGSRLPPIRDVAVDLGLSPSTVSAAWRLLAQAGAVRTDGRRGTIVMSRRGPGPTRYRRALQHSSHFNLDLSTGVPDAALLPDLSAALNNLHRGWTSGSYLDDAIVPGLVEALAHDWPYESDEFMIVDGAMDALDQVSSHLLRFGDKVIVENPSFPPLLDLLEALGVRYVGVDVDEEGLVPAQFADALAQRPRALFLQPRAHNPTGVSMSAARANELAQLVRTHAVMVIEDDSAGSVAAADPISLGRWIPSQTVHVRSFSKSHGPDLRLAAMSGPADVLDALRERRLLGQGWTSRLLQAVLLDLLTRPATRRQVEHARVTYISRRRKLCDALGREGVSTMGNDGLNLWLPVHDETAALISLASRGIGAAAGSPFLTRGESTPHLRITAGQVERDFAKVAHDLAGAAMTQSQAGPR